MCFRPGDYTAAGALDDNLDELKAETKISVVSSNHQCLHNKPASVFGCSQRSISQQICYQLRQSINF